MFTAIDIWHFMWPKYQKKDAKETYSVYEGMF